jgi:hypothetical protein
MMQTPKHPGPLTLTPHERQVLEAWQRKLRLPAGQVRRARAILLLADGLALTEVARRVDMGRHHVYMWVKRFEALGVEGLKDQDRSALARRGQAGMRAQEDS